MGQHGTLSTGISGTIGNTTGVIAGGTIIDSVQNRGVK